MKNSKAGFSIVELLIVIVLLAFAAVIISSAVQAADLSYTSRVQTGDSELERDNKAGVALTRLEYGNSYTNIAAVGTNAIAGPVVLDRVVIATAGTTSTLSLYDVTSSATNTIAIATTTAQGTLHLGVRVSGTLRAVTAGAAAGQVTLSYR